MNQNNVERMKHMLSEDPTRVASMQDLVYKATDLTDGEVDQFARMVYSVSQKFSKRANSVKNLEEMRDEILTRSADLDILVEVDPAPCLYGEPPTVEVIGKVASDPIHQYGFDHERKGYEVKEAKKRGELWRGQKENYRA